ncbi:MAG TPA: antibiotic biosynthesis monooxygenase [Thermomicrobiaceae bacterium]|nr:antibiotic biosynthesis monooxygenase [Thermomicrobiaceae bacterium]
MIARTWRGWTTPDGADAYQEHVTTAVLDHLRGVGGFRGLRLWRRRDGDEVEFLVMTTWATLDAVRGFAGDDIERAVVEPAARRVLTRFDDRCVHYDLAASSDGAA